MLLNAPIGSKNRCHVGLPTGNAFAATRRYRRIKLGQNRIDCIRPDFSIQVLDGKQRTDEFNMKRAYLPAFANGFRSMRPDASLCSTASTSISSHLRLTRTIETGVAPDFSSLAA